MHSTLIRISSLLCIVLAAVAASAIESSRYGTVAGAPTLNVRSGPGTEHRAITWLSEGERVRVEEIEQDQWAKVLTPRGDTGYVHTGYLVLAEAEVEPAAETEGATGEEGAAVEAEASDSATELAGPRVPEDLSALRARNDQLQEEVQTLRRQIVSMSTRADTSSRGVEDLRREMRHLVELTEEMRAELLRHRSGNGDGPGSFYEVDPLQPQPWATLFFGLIAGLLIGSIQGRRQERQRRSRIRL